MATGFAVAIGVDLLCVTAELDSGKEPESLAI